MTVFLVVTAAHRKRTEENVIQGVGRVVDSVTWSNPLPFYIPFWTEKVPLSYTFFLINGTLHLFYLFILPCKIYKEKRKKLKYTTEQNLRGSL